MRLDVNRLAIFALPLFLLATLSLKAQEPSTPAQAPAQPKNTMHRAVEWKRFDYTCEKEAKLTVYLRDQMVKVRFADKTYFMKQVPSAGGAHYSDGKVLWWGVGNGGFLQEDSPDGDGAMIVKDCRLDKPSATNQP